MFKEYGNTIIYGHCGAGKSYLIHRYLDEIIKSNDDYRLILIDFKSNEFDKYKNNDNLLKMFSCYATIKGKGFDDEETRQRKTVLDDIAMYRKCARLNKNTLITRDKIDEKALKKACVYQNCDPEQMLNSLFSINVPSNYEKIDYVNSYEVLDDIWHNYLKHRENAKNNSNKPTIYVFIDEIKLILEKNNQMFNRLIEIINKSARLNARLIISSQIENLFDNNEISFDTVINLNLQKRSAGDKDDLFTVCSLKKCDCIYSIDNMYEIRNKLDIIWSKKCSKEYAVLKFNEYINCFFGNSAFSRNKIKQLILYDPYGVKIKSEL